MLGSMRTFQLLLVIPLILMMFASCRSREQPAAVKHYDKPLQPGQQALREVGSAELPLVHVDARDRSQLRQGISNSLAYFSHPNSSRHYPVDGISRDDVIRSLQALDQLLAAGGSDEELNREIRARFRVLESIGCDEVGTVLFTGYYTPIWPASLRQDDHYRYPIYRRPQDLRMPPQGGDPTAGAANQEMPDHQLRPYPTRAEIRAGNLLRGQELAWLSDPFAAYCVEIQGSAKLLLPDGGQMQVGYDGTNNYAYHSVALDLVKDGKIRKEDLNYFTIRAYFLAHPEEAPGYLDRNPRFIFFKSEKGNPSGSLGQPVIGDITIATDKSIFPPGAPCLVKTKIADAAGARTDYAALRLDQDTGGGIKAPGHADLYMGEGDSNERRAGSQYQEGRLYYLILRQ
jgi:membrane-bound lytic murein transglycosylase A